MSERPLRIGHPERRNRDLCGCCEGTSLSTLRPIRNRPDLSAIGYRVGQHADFKASMLTALASADHPTLKAFGTREDDDFTIALIDAWAAACEVLSFYQERHANEAYIGTARERVSVAEIARLIGYELHPGAAAETDLVFLMDEPPGAAPSVEGVTIPEATRVRSEPGPEEEAQVFETLAPIEARVAWNRLRPRRSVLRLPKADDTQAWLQGQTTGLGVGDALLIVGRDRAEVDPGSERWDFRRVVAVAPDSSLDRTLVTWDRGLGPESSRGLPAQTELRFFAFREQAALFGHSAPHPLILHEDQRKDFGFTDGSGGGSNSPSRIHGSRDNPGDWAFTFDGEQISLDAVHKSFVAGGWVALSLPGGLVELYRIKEAAADALSKYAISGRATRLTLDTDENLGIFEENYRRVAVYGASEELAFAETPLFEWVSGSEIELDARVPDLPQDRRLILEGRRGQGRVTVDTLTLTAADGSTRSFESGARLTLSGPPEEVQGEPDSRVWQLSDVDGFVGTAKAPKDALEPVPADESAEVVAEAATLSQVEAADPMRSTLRLSSAPGVAFDRSDLVIHANVAPASHGESASEILGGGNPSRPFQSFTLKQSPVTHLHAPTESGVTSTLEVRIDGVAWQEVRHLYDRPRGARVFATSRTGEGETIVRFGDGRSGARPPAGRDNIVAEYRKGLGRAGNVPPRRLNQPLDRPLGLREVVNPLAASGGSEPDGPNEARHTAPTRTLTLGRLVSITDYRDFALTRPGIAKADARWIWDGWTRRIVVTVAGTGGETIDPHGTIYEALAEALRTFSDPLARFDVISYAPAHFRVGLRVAIDPAREAKAVLSAVESALRSGFGFEARDFAEPVALSQVVSVAHAVPGVRAVDVDRLHREGEPATEPARHPMLAARSGGLGPHGALRPAEILTLSPLPIHPLEEMS